jgi:hypothetical protein
MKWVVVIGRQGDEYCEDVYYPLDVPFTREELVEMMRRYYTDLPVAGPSQGPKDWVDYRSYTDNYWGRRFVIPGTEISLWAGEMTKQVRVGDGVRFEFAPPAIYTVDEWFEKYANKNVECRN